MVWQASRVLTGTGFAQPKSGAPLSSAISGNRIVPIGSAWTSGFSETRPSNRAVGSPHAVGGHRVGRTHCTRQREQQDDKRDEGLREKLMSSKVSSNAETAQAVFGEGGGFSACPARLI